MTAPLYAHDMRLGFEHTYAALPPVFHTAVQPAAVPAPSLRVWNDALAIELNLDTAAIRPVAQELFSGRHRWSSCAPLPCARLASSPCGAESASSMV
jgi:uncharacterized protein YdiU (UPF0061 family)